MADEEVAAIEWSEEERAKAKAFITDQRDRLLDIVQSFVDQTRAEFEQRFSRPAPPQGGIDLVLCVAIKLAKLRDLDPELLHQIFHDEFAEHTTDQPSEPPS